MAPQATKNVKITRFRLKEIGLQPNKSSYEIKAKVIVDGTDVQNLPPIKKLQPLCWKDLKLPCDLSPNSQLAIEVIEIHTFKDRVALATCSASEIANKDTLSIDCDNNAFTVGLCLLSKEDAQHAYSSAFSSVQQMESQQSIMEKAGKFGLAFKVLLNLGSTMADLDPTGGAKIAFTICTQALQHLEQQDKQNVDLNGLVEDLAGMTPSVEVVKELANTNLGETVMAMLGLIEDTSLFILRYKSHSPWAHALHSIVDPTSQDQIQTFISKLRKLRKEFDTRVSVQTFETIHVDNTQAKLENLKPVLAGYDPTRVCLPGTRVEITDEVTTWALDTGANPRISWIHGLAGLGKSSIAASVCQRLNEQKILAASFFCKRDNAELRDPRRVVTNIAYGLALRLKSYKEAVVAAIRTDPEVLTGHIQPLYDGLVTKPLQSIEDDRRPTGMLVVVVDALDECGDDETRKQLLICLRKLSQAATWIKVVVTSRPDHDIQEFFGQAGTNWFTEWNVLSYDALDDIQIFIQNYLGDVTKVENWPHDAAERLSHRASGLFIWARTACKFICDGYDPHKRLEQVLAGQRLSDPVAELDALYSTTVKIGTLDGEEDNLMVVLKCLGAIVVTATRTPLPSADLVKLLGGYIPLHALNRVLRSLGSVLYLDKKQGGAIRLSHPSFMDFITNPSRSKQLCVNLDEQNTILTECCLETLKRDLKFNICELETSHVLNCDTPNLETRVQAAIGPHLSYSCLYWSSHLAHAQNDQVKSSLREFLFDRALLYWLEALSLLGKLSVAPPSLLSVSLCVIDDMKDCQTYSYDAYRFVLAFYDAISKSAPHLYVSALALAPVESKLAQRMRPFFTNMMTVTQGGDKLWTPCLRSILVPSAVHSVAFSPDGRRIVSGSPDSTVRAWDAETGDPVLEPLQGHSGWVTSVAFSPDGRRIISGSDDNMVRIWDAETGNSVLQPLQCHSAVVCSVAFSPDGRRIISGSDDNMVRIWDAETRDLALAPLEGHSERLTSVAFSTDGRRIVSGSDDNTVRIWDAEMGGPALVVLQGHSERVTSVAFSPDGQRIVSGSDDYTLRVWDAERGNQVLVVPQGHLERVTSVAFSPDGQRIISGSSENTIQIWDAETGNLAFSPLQGHSDVVNCVAFSPDGRYIVSGSDDNTIRIWDADAGDPAPELPQGHSSWVNSVAFSSDGRRIVSGSNDSTVRVWDTETGKPMLAPLEGHSDVVNSVAFSPDGRRIVSGSDDTMVRIWDAETGDPMRDPLEGHLDAVSHVTFSPDGRRIASSSLDNTVRIWDPETGNIALGPLQGHSAGVQSVAFSSDSRLIVSGSWDNTIRVWNMEAGDLVLEILECHSAGVHSVSFSPDIRRIVSGSDDNTVRIWDAEAGISLLAPLEDHSAGVQSVAFSPDGRRIVSGSGDDTVRIWDAETGHPVLESLQGHLSSVQSVAFSPDGRFIVSGSLDYTVRVWDAGPYTAISPSTPQCIPGTELAVLMAHTRFNLSSTSSQLFRHIDSNGWVAVEGNLLLWLPSEFRRIDYSLICISAAPSRRQLVLDFSKFVHGSSWASIAKV